MIRTLSLAAVLAALSAVPAAAFLADNGLQVRAMSDGTIHVMPSPGQGPAESWCAVGDYVISRGLPTNTRIWRLSEPPRRQGEGVRFGLSPEGAASRTGLFILGSKDASLSAIHARTLCRPRLPF
ncbi:hypothetical protein [Rhodobacter sp. CZR27]|uniref:hypothetical protein n=1 Tax=Rhodobacter sp. CZR27 TaxID=2033869 RepID=UPI000BBEDF62|nr:hypothetical protein [Rhodobacter sp. CZR27]